MLRGEIHHPFDAVFVAEHPKIRTPWTIVHGHFDAPAGRKPVEYPVGFLTALGADRDFGAVLVFIDPPHELWDVVAHEQVFPDGQGNVHDFVGLLTACRELRACEVFEADDIGKRPAEYRLVKLKCFFGIPVKVDVWIDQCHVFCFSGCAWLLNDFAYSQR